MSLRNKTKLAREEAGVPEKSRSTGTVYEAIEAYLLGLYDFRYNVVLATVEYREQGGNWERLQDRVVRSMLRDMRFSFGLKVNKTQVDETIDSDFSKPYHPFEDYFQNLPEAKGDHIAELAKTVTLSDESERGRFTEMLKRWLVACVGCALYRDHINETMLIFVGGQGGGKTRWFKKLTPPSLQDYFKKGLGNLEDKDSQVALSERFIILLDELVTLRKNDIEAIKSLTSESEVVVRRPYERRTEVLMRRANFAGADNNEDIINDPTGARRFLIFAIEETNYQHDIDIDLVWSQAYRLFEEGYQYWLDKEEIEVLNKANDRFQIKTTEEELIVKYFKEGEDFFTASDILRHINSEEGGDNGKAIVLPTNQVTLRKIGAACRALGFEKIAKKVNGKTARGYLCEASSERGAEDDKGEFPFS